MSKVGLKMILFWCGNVYKFMFIDIDIILVMYIFGWLKLVKVFLFYVLSSCDEVGYYIVFKLEGGDFLL